MNVWRASHKKDTDEATLRELAAFHQPENPEAKQAGDEVRRQLFSCLDGLSPRETEVFLLRDIEETSVQETARILRISTLSIRVHLSRAREKIRKRVKERFPELLEGRR